jgi:hypothetical protein
VIIGIKSRLERSRKLAVCPERALLNIRLCRAVMQGSYAKIISAIGNKPSILHWRRRKVSGGHLGNALGLSIPFNGTGTMNFLPSTMPHLLKIPQPNCTTDGNQDFSLWTFKIHNDYNNKINSNIFGEHKDK